MGGFMPNRRKFIKNTLISAAGITVFSSFDILKRNDDEFKLTILHTNDMHSRIDAFPSNDGKYPNQGGMMKIAKLIKQVRLEEENMLLLDAGDVFQGTPYFNVFKGEIEFKLMSEMGYDASTIGNHDFDIGLDGFKNALQFANFPFICSNYDFSNTILNSSTIPYKIFNKKNIKIGVFGIGIKMEGLIDSRLRGNTIYNDPIKTANYYARFLKKEKKCNIVICLSHLGYQYSSDEVSDKILAKNTKNIDLIIGGHTHTFLDSAVSLKNEENKKVLINQAGWSALKLGRVDFFFSKNKSQNTDFEAHRYFTKNYAKI